MHRCLVGAILFVTCLGTITLVRSQSLPEVWRHIDESEGYPQYQAGHEILQDGQGNVWSTYENGLHKYDGHVVTRYGQNKSDSTALPEDNVRSLYIDEEGKMWVSTINSGLAIFDPASELFRRIAPKSQGGPLPLARIWEIYRAPDGKIWLAGKGGLALHHPETSQYSHYTFFENGLSEPELEYFNIIRTICSHPSDAEILFLGTRSGLLSFDTRTKLFTRYPYPHREHTYLDPLTDEYMIMDLHFSSPEILWMTSWSGGILSYNLSTNQWEQHRDPHADPLYDVIWKIKPRTENTVWIASAVGFGIFNLNTKEYTYSNYTSPVDNRGLRFCQDFTFTSDSIIILHTRTGLFISEDYKGQGLLDVSIPPYISELKINGSPVRDGVIPYVNSALVLDEDQNNISCNLAWPVFHNPSRYKFQFLLTGFDDDWVDNSNSRFIQYNNLRSGKYQLNYRASIGGDDWHEGLQPLLIEISRPFWKEPLFILITALLVMISILLIYRWRINQITSREKMKTEFNRQLAEQEMSTLRAQMNPHFMFNSLNSIKTYILKEKPREASLYLTKFSKLMRAVLRNSNMTLVPLMDEIDTLKLYIELESLRFPDKFDYQITMDSALQSNIIKVPPLLIQPYVENAIRHGLLEKKSGSRMLRVDLKSLNDEFIEIIIEDNGIGRKASGLKNRVHIGSRKSRGMDITKNRLQLLEQTLGITAKVDFEDMEDFNGIALGTKVSLVIPKIEKTEAQ